MIGENVLPQQIGLERVKYSRLVEKQTIKLSLKKLSIPQAMQDELKKQLFNKRDENLLRLKIEVGEFYCYTAIFTTNGQTVVEMKEDLDIDINEAKYLKISLVASRGRTSNAKKSLLNELLPERVISWTSLKLQDFQAPGAELVHNIPFTQGLYQVGQRSLGDGISLNCVILIKAVNGASESVEMEGAQLLVGRYVLYKENSVARVLRANKATCKIEILEGQPLSRGEKVIDNVVTKTDIRMIERQGISHYNLDGGPP